MFKKYAFVLFVAVLVLASLACGGPNGCGDTVSMDDPICQPTSTPMPAAGQGLVEDILNAASNANGDGEADTTHCDGIVC